MLRAIARARGGRIPIDDRGNVHGRARGAARSTATRRDAYVDLVVDEMIPAVAASGLAEWCDVFCEDGCLHAGRVAADPRGRPAARAEAADPRRRARPERRLAGRGRGRRAVGRPPGLRAPTTASRPLAAAGVAATLLPVAAFYLKLGRFAPARALIDAGVPVALATDVNPGGGFSPSMPFAMALACFGMDMTFEEALVGATINGAWSLDRADRVGSLEPGKLADAVIVDGDADQPDPRRRPVRSRRSSSTGASCTGGLPGTGRDRR